MNYYNYGGIYSAPPFLNNYPDESMNYWSRSFMQRFTGLIDFENLPAPEVGYKWDKDALKYGMLMRGFQAVFESKKYGLVVQPCTLSGYGLQMQPSDVLISTPYFQFTEPLKIGVQCELLKLTPDYSGVWDIITKYAGELKEIDTSIKAAARNSRLAFALIAANDKSAKTLKGVRERIQNGEDVIIDETLLRSTKDGEALPWHEFNRDLKSSYILSDLLNDRRTTIIDFYREIGVRMLDDKKERMLTAEVDAGNAETFIRSEVWIETLKDSCEKVNKMFGTNIKPILNRPDIPGGGESNVL